MQKASLAVLTAYQKKHAHAPMRGAAIERPSDGRKATTVTKLTS